ncbi:hypothetical protein MPS_5058 [Mycobacterium pseudoshottsii JCM 15466]|nr:hypothetical protein MPS_5058 [Mycobacterium pseudoshottsii JCM 15466]
MAETALVGEVGRTGWISAACEDAICRVFGPGEIVRVDERSVHHVGTAERIAGR